MIKYEGSKNLVDVSLADLNKLPPNTKIKVSRVWVDQVNSLLNLIEPSFKAEPKEEKEQKNKIQITPLN